MPVGSLEQHGPHLPLATDTMVAATVARGAAEQLAVTGGEVLVAPAVAYGASGEHEDFPGTISIGHDALHVLLVELGRSACRWAAGVVFVNGHGGNVAAVRGAADQLHGEGRAVSWYACAPPHGDAHAGRTETSLLHHFAPAAVDRSRFEAGVGTPLVDLMPRLRRDGVRAVTPNGVLGDPHGSSPEEGQRLVAGLVAGLIATVRELAAGTELVAGPEAVDRDRDASGRQ